LVQFDTVLSPTRENIALCKVFASIGEALGARRWRIRFRITFIAFRKGRKCYMHRSHI